MVLGAKPQSQNIFRNDKIFCSGGVGKDEDPGEQDDGLE